MKKFKNFKIFIADRIHSEGIRILRKEGFDVIECYDLPNFRLAGFISRNIKGKDGNHCLIVRSVRTIGKSDIDVLKSSSLKLICTASSGFDNIDFIYCKRKKIDVLNIPLGNYVPAAEHTIAMILSILKHLSDADKDVKRGIFDEKKYSNYEFSGKKIGIIGVGRVGSHVAKISRAFGVTVLGNDIKRGLISRYKWIIFKRLNDLLKEADIVSVHTPLDESTVNLLDGKRLHLLKNNAILINCARGGIVNERELINMLIQKKIYYAGIDVFKNEPNIDKGFGKLKNVLLTPHLAGKTVESRKRISIQLAGRIIEYYSRKLKKMA